MPVEIFIVLLVGGLLLTLIGIISLIYKLYKINTVQGAVSETNSIFALLFSLLNWKQTKSQLIILLCGLAMLSTLFLV